MFKKPFKHAHPFCEFDVCKNPGIPNFLTKLYKKPSLETINDEDISIKRRLALDKKVKLITILGNDASDIQ